MARFPTAVLAAGSLIGGYGVAMASGSRPLGGLVLAAGGLGCARIWTRRHGPRVAALLTGAGLAAFALSHVIAHVVGAWAAVLGVAAAIAALAWASSDAPRAPRAGAA
jgi:hypothetical protein